MSTLIVIGTTSAYLYGSVSVVITMFDTHPTPHPDKGHSFNVFGGGDSEHNMPGMGDTGRLPDMIIARVKCYGLLAMCILA